MDSTAAEIADKATHIPDFWIMIVKSFGMLLIVLGVLFAVAYIIKKISGANTGIVKGEIRLLSLFHIAPKEKIVLIETNGKKVLLGITPENINRLEVFDSDENHPVEDVKDSQPKGFASMLKNRLKPDVTDKPRTGDTQCTDNEQET